MANLTLTAKIAEVTTLATKTLLTLPNVTSSTMPGLQVEAAITEIIQANSTTASQASPDVSPLINILTALVLIVISVVGIFGNLSVIVVIVMNANLRTITYLYLTNLALADLILSLSMPLWAAMYYNNTAWPFGGNFTCKAARFLTKQNLYASVGILTGLSIDRALAVVFAKARNRNANMALSGQSQKSFLGYLFANSSVAASLGVIWGLSILFALPELLYSSVKPSQTIEDTVHCTFSAPADSLDQFLVRMGAYETFVLMVGFIVPIFVLTVCYSLIIATVNSRMIGKGDRKKRAILLAARVVVVFFVCYAPQQCLRTYSILYGWFKVFKYEMTDWEKKFHHSLYIPATCLAFLNSAINPFIYGFGVTAFKQTFFKMLGFKFVKRDPTRPEPNKPTTQSQNLTGNTKYRTANRATSNETGASTAMNRLQRLDNSNYNSLKNGEQLLNSDSGLVESITTKTITTSIIKEEGDLEEAERVPLTSDLVLTSSSTSPVRDRHLDSLLSPASAAHSTAPLVQGRSENSHGKNMKSRISNFFNRTVPRQDFQLEDARRQSSVQEETQFTELSASQAK